MFSFYECCANIQKYEETKNNGSFCNGHLARTSDMKDTYWNQWNLSFRHVLFHEKNSFSDISRKGILPNTMCCGSRPNHIR